MKPCCARLVLALCLAGTTAVSTAQSSPATPASSASQPASVVPQLVRFAGTLFDLNGKPLTGTVGVTFALYKDQQGGAPLWLETQNVQADGNGHYSVMLGSTTAEGLPADLFSSGDARWLGVEPAGQPEQARVMLLSVPYALKAGDAQTLGGLPPSAFMLAVPSTSTSTPSADTTAAANTVTPNTSSDVTTTGGAVNTLPLFSTATNIQSSILTQSGSGSTGKVGINNASPSTTLDVGGAATIRGSLSLPATGTATATAGKNSQPHDFIASAFNSTTSTAVPEKFQLQAEPAGNDTASTSGTLNLLYASGTAIPAETGLKISSKGLVTFASGQTFPGTGPGTITGITTASGSGLTGGGTSGTLTLSVGSASVTNAMLANPSVTVSPGAGMTGGGKISLGGTAALGLASNSCAAGNAITALPFTCSPFASLGANTFTGNQTVSGAVTATSFSGNGAALANVNAAALGGLAPGAFALLAGGNSFTGTQSLTGNLAVNGTVAVSGSGDGVTYPDGTTQYSAAIFASATTGSLVIFSASGVTNLLELTVTVPANGLLFATASGYCNLSTGTSTAQWSYDIATSPTAGWNFPDPLILFPSGSNVGQFPISGTKVIAVSAGSNSIYLNVDNVTGTPLTSCGAQLTAVFTPAQLPASAVARPSLKSGRVVSSSTHGVVGTPE